MRTHYVAFVATAGLLFVAGVSAQAAGRGGVGTPFVPHGLTSTNPGFTNGDKGNNIAPVAPATTPQPSGWSQGGGKAPDPWKGISSPPGLNGTGR